MISNEKLRERARMQLGNGIFEQPWLNMLAICFIYSAIIGLASSASSGLVTLIIGGPLLYGLSGITLACAKGRGWRMEDLFNGFTSNFTNSLVLYLLESLFTMLWSLLFIIPGIVKSYAYSMAFFIQNENPNLPAKECLKESERMMQGYKWQLFCLDLSFIGWYLLGSFCFGIGTLFVVPYHQVARANFYAELTKEIFVPQDDFTENTPPKDDTNEIFF